MADLELVIKIPESKLRLLKNEFIKDNFNIYELASYIDKGTQLPKGHGRLIDESRIKKCGWNFINHYAKTDAPTIIKADKEYEAKAITHGNCMICGKELTEGLFFCKECEEKAKSRKWGEWMLYNISAMVAYCDQIEANKEVSDADSN